MTSTSTEPTPSESTSGGSTEFDPVVAPDEQARRDAEEYHLRSPMPTGSLGELEMLGNWLAACQGHCPPRQFQRARVVVFAGDHGVAARRISAYPAEVTRQRVAAIRSDGAAVNALARLADASVRVVDMAVDGDTDPTVSAHKVRRASGAIDVEDALYPAELEAALAAGKAIADEEVDAGADLLIAGGVGVGNGSAAAASVAALTDSEPIAVVGRGTGIDDMTWMRNVAAIRDAAYRARRGAGWPVDARALLRIAAGADIAAVAAFLAQAAIRRTPAIIDGVVVTAAALIAEQLAPGARSWWVAGHRSPEPAHTLALRELDLAPLLDYHIRLDEGTGAVLALPILRAAIATFDPAGVSERHPAQSNPVNAAGGR